MTSERYKELMDTDRPIQLTDDEIEAGWHFCYEFDGLLVGPGMQELQVCTCLDGTDFWAQKVSNAKTDH